MPSDIHRKTDIYRKRKIVMMGSRGVGKSSLAFRFVEDGLYSEAYFPTISNTFEKTMTVDEQERDVFILDTAGLDEFSILNSHHIIGIHGFIIVYSVASRASFENAKLIFDRIISFCGRTVPAVLVAQKADLARREVSEAQGRALAQQMGVPHIEASAKDDHNVAEVFEVCLAEVEKRYGRRTYVTQPSPPPEPKRCVIM
ncbi:P-loop containing nucleoside triphosphate hydrolase protein [Auriculariales sp. MPI-PUGE-AT-0066]|nr:P-loop containing nucleoside triphosphate hydrolase protein [Auriculariales sp. MPI-PUGE-AT-0066]